MTAIVGHRGGRSTWPENSLWGFRQAAALGVSAIEFDIRLTSAGEVVVIHDATLDRTVEGTGAVNDLTPSSRARFKLKGLDETIPRLDDVLEVLSEHQGIQLHVELKCAPEDAEAGRLVELAADALGRHGVASRSLLTSFHLPVLAQCKAIAPSIDRLLSVDRSSSRDQLELHLIQAESLASVVAIQKDLLTSCWKVARTIVPLDRLCVWVVNDANEIDRWLDIGVGYLTSDDPTLALERVRR
jgi:glycerophosphoryl diester phosphodiesterase